MRTARSIFAGAALTACLALGAPAAHATGALNAYDPSTPSWHHSGGASVGSDSASDPGAAAADPGDADHGWQHPHGGMHTGGGGMSLAGGSGLAGGAVLLLGGLGAGAFALRRRGNGSRATAAL